MIAVSVPANDPLPGNSFEVQWSAGVTSRGSGLYAACLVGAMLPTGTATPNTLYGPLTTPPFASEADAIQLFGETSELVAMARTFWLVNRTTPLWAIATSPLVGAGAALYEIPIAGKAKSTGSLRIYVGAAFVEVGILPGHDAAIIAQNAVSRVSERSRLPVTASVVEGSKVRLTARQAGARGNLLRGGFTLTGADGVTIATSGAQAFFTGGAVTEDNFDTLLATLAPKRFYYTTVAMTDPAQLATLAGFIDSQADALTGIRQRLLAASNETLARAVRVATGVNNARVELHHLAECDWTPAEMAAHVAGVVAKYEAPFPFRTNFSFFGTDANTQADWRIPAPRSGAAPTRPNLVSALQNGVSPIGVSPNGQTYLVDRITTRSLSGGQPDYSITGAHKVTVIDRYGDRLLEKFDAQFKGCTVDDDPPPRSPRQRGPKVITPTRMKAAVDRLTRDFGDVDLLQQVDETIAETAVERPLEPRTRLVARVPLAPCDNLLSTVTLAAQVA